MANKQKSYTALYKKLLALYPTAFKDRFGESMEQTFNDLCSDQRQTKKGLFWFVQRTFIETATGIIHEHILLITEGGIMKNIISNPTSAAVVGFLFALPFLVLNTIVGNQIEPFLTLIRPTGHTSNFEYVLLAVVLLLLPIGAFIAARPIFQHGAKQKFYIVNIAIAAVLVIGFVALSLGLGSDIYRCDVLQIPNCD